MNMEPVCKHSNNENIVDIFIIFGLLIVKIYGSFLFWKKKSRGFEN